MLKLIYSPYYDGNCYAGNPAKNACVIGEKYVGSLGLLDELELRAGMSRGDISPMQRAIAYCNAIHKFMANNPTSKPFYKESFDNDPLGVAQQLLRWRDALCMAGWNKDTTLPNSLSADGKNRLADLQKIEVHFNIIGIGERWQILLAEAKDRNILPDDVSIEVNMKMEYLPPVIRKVLDEIKNKGGKVTESKDVAEIEKKSLGDFANKFTLYEFPDQVDAYQWAALQSEYKADVLINEDNFTFNQVLKSVGKPLVSSSIEGGATDLLQLLKLGISLFRKPINYANLMSYLSIFRHPIDKDLRRKLREHLQSTGGFGINNNGEKMPEVKGDNAKFWRMWELSKEDNEEKESDIANFCKNLLEWVENYTPEAEKQISFFGMHIYSQLSVLKDKINSLLTYIKGKGTISNDELEKVIATICQGDTLATDIAKLGSYDMLDDLKGLAIKGQSILWLDCVRKPRPCYEYSFLNPSDIDNLKLDIPKPELEMHASDFAELLAVSHANEIVALIPKHKDGERTDENLLITELKTSCPAIPITMASLPETNTEAVEVAKVNTQEIEYHLEEVIFKDIKTLPKTEEDTTAGEEKRIEEDTTTGEEKGIEEDATTCEEAPKIVVECKKREQSYSSLNELINYPFDYVFDYILEFKDKESDSSLSTIEGNVAHRVIHQMVEECKKDTKVFIQMCNDETGLFEKLDKAIMDCGLELLLPENSLELHIFKRTLVHKSIPVLARIIDKYNLEIEDSEVDYGVVKDKKFNYKGFIDFVLKKKNNDINKYEYYIFDFKWTNHPDKRKEELEQRKELQLAFYERIMAKKGKKVVMRGYYLLKQGKLLTAYKGFKEDDDITVVQPSTCNIFKQAVNSYKERIDDLYNGIIEEGDDNNGTDFGGTSFIEKYLSDTDNKYYLKNGMWRNKTSKNKMAGTKSGNFEKNVVLKGKIE